MQMFLQPYSFRFLLDLLLTHALVTSLVIVSWSTLWLFQFDLLSHFKASTANLVALVSGYLLVLAALLLDRELGRIRRKLDNFSWMAALAFEDLVTFTSWFYLGFLWRGAWLTAERYVRVLDSDLASAGLSFCLGVVGLGLCRCSQWPDSLSCDVDGSHSDNSKVIFGVSVLKAWSSSTSKAQQMSEVNDTSNEQS